MGWLNALLIFSLFGSIFADSNLDLWLAAKTGHPYDPQDALSAGADPEWINPENNWDQWTALHWAAYNDYSVLVNLLLDNGAYVNKATHSSSNPLILAARAGNIDTVNVLIGRGAAVNWQGISFTALISAAVSTSSNRPKVMDALLFAGADTDMESNGRTALYMASEMGHTDAVSKLISHGADLNMKTWNGEMTALMIAVQVGNFDVVVSLLEANADIHLTDERGLTALHIAAKYNQAAIAQWLLQNGADPEQQDDYGRTPRDIAEENGVSSQELINFSVLIDPDDLPVQASPLDPVDPVVEANPVEPRLLAASYVPVAPADPVDSYVPIERADLVDSYVPVERAELVDSYVPVERADPVDSYVPAAPVEPSEHETSTVTSDYAVYMLSGGVIMSMATSVILILT